MRTWHRPPVRARPPTHRNDTDTDTPAPHRPTPAAEASKVQRRPGINLPALQWPLPDTAWLKSPDTDGHPVRHALFPCTGYGLRWTPSNHPEHAPTTTRNKRSLLLIHFTQTPDSQRHNATLWTRPITGDSPKWDWGSTHTTRVPHRPICYTAASIFVLCIFYSCSINTCLRFRLRARIYRRMTHINIYYSY